jgi:hypothetical protein
MRRALWLGLFLTAGCDDHTFPLPGEGGGGDGPAYTSDWEGAQEFMGDHCEGCHPQLSAPDMPIDIADDIIDGSGRYIVPGDPMASEFWLVIIDESEQTSIMPLGIAQPLPENVVQPIFDWIEAGASLE